jgi:hypothetical protein
MNIATVVSIFIASPGETAQAQRLIAGLRPG